MSANQLCVLVLVAACGKADDKSAEMPAERTKPAPTAAPNPASASVDTPASATPEVKDLCRAFDKDAVAAALGWKSLAKVSGTGTKLGDKISRNCGFHARGEANAEGSFGVSFSTDLAFENKHIGFDLVYKPRAAIDGMEAWSAGNAKAVGLQVVAKGVRIETTVTRAGDPAEVEPKLVDATRKLVATLPAEPAALLRK